MKYRSFHIVGLLLISLTVRAQVDSVKFWKEFAKLKVKEANQTAEAARKAKLQGDRLHFLMIANDISNRSQELIDKRLATLLAIQAYNFNLQYSGYEYNNYVYGGLIAALKKYDSLPVKLKNTQTSLALFPNSKTDSVRINKDLIKAGTNGDVIILTKGIVRRKLAWHQDKVEHIGISPSRKFLVSLSKDMTICIWSLSDLTRHPIVIKENASIDGVTFSSDETQILVRIQSKKPLIHAWPLTMGTMARSLCSCIEKNMTLEEWEQYVGKDEPDGAPYEATCKSFPSNKK